MPWSNLIDLSYSDTEKEERYGPMTEEARPSCPPGLCIMLTEREIEKLGLKMPTAEGDLIDIRAFGTVGSGSFGRGNKSLTIELNKIAVENEMDENPDEEIPEKVSRRYRKG